MTDDIRYLYGGDKPWDASLWVTSDDRVRGGASCSQLSVDGPRRARFHGNLDTETLGGAGFASQHSRGELSLDLSDYEGIIVAVAGPEQADGKCYALTLKDEVPSSRDDGREQAGVSWEAKFVVSEPGDVKLRWKDFKATYRGRPKKDAKPLDLKNIKRVGLMMRSFFGKQQGDFCLHLDSIAAWKRTTVQAEEENDDDDEEDPKARAQTRPRQAKQAWWRRLLCGMV